MDKAVEISVLVPAYNCAAYISQCIDSILGQDFAEFELLICDDGSTDNTSEVISAYSDPRIKLLKNETNQGNVFTFNKLLKNATGKFIALQDADDWSEHNRFSLQLRHLRENPNLVACYTQMHKTDLKGDILFTTSYPLKSDQIKKLMPLHFHVVCASILFKKELLDQIGNYPEYFKETGGADWYWTYRLFEKYQAENLTEVLYYYRTNPKSITQEKTNNFRKFFISEILIFLIKQRKKHESDALENDSLKPAFHTFEKQLEHQFKTDPIIQHKRAYVQARLAGNKSKRKEIYNEMMQISSAKTLAWFATKPFSMLANKIRISLS